jgi:BirA family biotin operon repressor/biotin-[acetyl-CoA-carboxylase] ligase
VTNEPLDVWRDALVAAVARTAGAWERVTVLDETVSTQDAARDLGPRPGDVVVAARQRAGRGRLGRAWADTASDGAAISLVVEAAATERLAVAAAVGAARAIESVLSAPVGIKWPNDVIAERRKLSGILIEHTGALAIIGIGVNVGQTTWPPALAGRAISLAELGASVARIDVLCAVVESLPVALRASDDWLREAFAARDVLVGTERAFRTGERTVAGRVLEVDPLRGITVDAGDVPVWLPAATTTVLDDASPAG